MKKLKLFRQELAGRLPKKLLVQWQKMTATRKKLEASLEKLDAKQREFVTENLKNRTPDVNGMIDAYINGEGEIYATFCLCARCQAKLNGVSLEDYFQGLIDQQILPQQMVAYMRALVQTGEEHPVPPDTKPPTLLN